VRIAVRDERGAIVREVDAIAYKGLLALAHEDDLRRVTTRIVQLPTRDNGLTAVVFARVRTRRGVFSGVGDANPQNVNPEVVQHLLRVAETRAIARALRLAVNVAAVSIEELGAVTTASPPEASKEPGAASRGERDGHPVTEDGRPPRFRGRDDRPTDARRGDDRAMSSEQRRLLFRLAYSLGDSRESAADRVLKALGVERFEWATRAMASSAIDRLKAEANRRPSEGNGASHG
jgi:hypothetical protein